MRRSLDSDRTDTRQVGELDPVGERDKQGLPTSVMLRYGFGQMGAQIFRDTPAALLPVFMTTILGIPAWLAGVAILIPKLWVIVCDPLMGLWSDRLAGRIGRTPFLAAGAIATSIGFLVLFNVGQFESEIVAAALVSAIFLLGMTAFSAFSVPYLGIAASLSSDPHERTKLLVFRMLFVSVGVLLGIGVAQPMVYWFGGQTVGWKAMGAIFSLICLVSMLGSTIGLHPVLKKVTIATASTPSLKDQLRAAALNRPFLHLTIIHFVQTVGQACSYTVVALVFIYLAGNVDLLIPFVFLMAIMGMMSQPVWLRLSRSMGKLKLFVWLCIAWCAVTTTWFGIEWGAGSSFTLPILGDVTGKELLILVRGGLIGITNAGFLLLVTSLFTDTVRLGMTETGAAVEGSYAGFWSASEKLAFAIGPLIAGVVLSLYGFESSREGIIEQSATAQHGILMIYAGLPILIFLASLLLVPVFARAMREREQAGLRL
ncbi:MAG: MFS transporter [Gammaproteobacteria bacterium]